MIEWLLSQHVVLLAFLAGLFTWGCTILGSAVVLFFTQVNRRLLDATMGFAAGVIDRHGQRAGALRHETHVAA